MAVTKGKILKPQKVVIYGPEGIGKSSLAAMFPNGLFLDIEDGTYQLDVAREEKASSLTMLLAQIKKYKGSSEYDTIILDTADRAETLCKSEVCAEHNKNGIEDLGYHKGYVYSEEKFGQLLNALSDLIESGLNVVVVAHAEISKFDLPEETGSFNRWGLKLEKETSPLLKEWSDLLLFINYKTYVIKSENKMEKAKAKGGARVIYTTHHACWDAKNRHGLPEELSFNSPKDGWNQIKHCIPARIVKPVSNPQPQRAEEVAQDLNEPEPTKTEPVKSEAPKKDQSRSALHDVPKPLADLMIADSVTVEEIQKAVAKRGYYPIDTPIPNYDSNFINGCLVGAWEQVFKMIKDSR